MPPWLKLSIIKYESRVSGATQGKKLRFPLHIGVVAIEKGVFESRLTTVDQLNLLIYIYIYIFTNLISTSIHGTRKKTKKQKKKPWQGTRDKSISNHRPGEKEKSFLGKKERKGQPRPTPWKKSRGTQSVVKRKPKNPPRMLQCYNY